MIGQQLSLFDDPLPTEISQEEIDRCICVGSGVCGGRKRIFEQFQRSTNSAENAQFLKAEYGQGGCCPAYGVENRSEELWLDYDSRGIFIRRRDDMNQCVKLTWPQAERRTRYLIDAGLYTPEE